MAEVDWNYSDTSIYLKLTHENIAVASYFQSVTPTIALEGIDHPGQEQMHTRYVAKYDNRKVNYKQLIFEKTACIIYFLNDCWAIFKSMITT